jgi:hypothetical protein
MSGHLIVLHSLRAGQQPRIESQRLLEVLHHFLAFLEKTKDCRTGFSLRLLIEQLEDLLQSFDLRLGLFDVLFERRAKFVGIYSLGHFRQGHQNLLLRIVESPVQTIKEVEASVCVSTDRDE